MTNSTITSDRISRDEDQIAEQLKIISSQRKLIADFEAQEKSARPQRELLRKLLKAFELTLAQGRQKSDTGVSA
jgi:hypothetical protein